MILRISHARPRVGLRVATLLSFPLSIACAQSPPPPATGSGGALGAATGGAINGAGGHGGAVATGGESGGSIGVGGVAGQPDDDRRFVPEGLPNDNVNGMDEGLVLAAFTLVQGASGPALYAAVKNAGEAPACEPGMTTDFYDKAGQRVSSAGSVLQTGTLYRMSDGTIISCLAPGQIAMAAASGLPDAIVMAELGHLEHLFPAFIVPDIVPIAGLMVNDVQSVAADTGSAYSGKVTNQLDVAVSAPKVTIFPLNHVGRPLGAATSSSMTDVPPGGSWTFETSSVNDPGVGYLAFPAASIPQ